MKHKTFILSLLILLLIFWIGLIPVMKAGNDFPYSSISFVANLFALPTAWSPFNGPFGQNQLSTLWSWPNTAFYAFGAKIGLSYGGLISYLGILPILLIGFWGVYKYSSLFFKQSIAGSTASLFYLANSYLVLVIDGGQLLWGLAYAVIPYCLYEVEKKILKKDYRISIGFMIPFIILSFCDLRAVGLVGIILGMRFFYQFLFLKRNDYFTWFSFWFKAGVLIGFSLVLLHAYWLLPLWLSGSAIKPAGLTVSSKADFLQFISLAHAIFFQQPHWFKNIFGNISQINPLFGLIPIFALLGVVINRKSKQIGFILVLLVVGIFLAKGSNPPFGESYIFLLEKVPGFSLFRDSSKFFVFIGFSYAFLIGNTIESLIILQKIRFIKQVHFVPPLVIIFLLVLMWPVFTNRLTGILAFPKQMTEYSEIEKKLSDQPDSGRILWVPNKPPLGYSDNNNQALNATDLISLRPFATGTRGTYETLNFLREASYSGELLKISGVKELVYPPLNPNKEYKPDELAYYDLFWQQLKGRQWTTSENSRMLSIPDSQALFFIPQETYLVSGSDQIYGDSTKSAELSLSQNGLVFLDQNAGLVKKIPEQLRNFILYKTSNVDLAMSFIDSQVLQFPAKNLLDSPDQTGWWKREAGDFLQFKDFLVQKYGVSNQDFDLGGGWAIAEGEKSLQIPIEGNPGDKIFVRAMQSTRSGQLKVAGGQEIGTIDLKNKGDMVFWSLAGTLSEKTNSLTLSATGDITVLNAIAVLSDSQLKDSLNQVSRYIPEKASALLKDIPGGNPEVVFSKINNDQYRVQVMGLQKPSTLVFSQSYDPKWQINGQPSFPVYSIFNGFLVDHDGEYLVEYSPHRYLVYGELISLTTLLVLGGLLIWKTVKH